MKECREYPLRYAPAYRFYQCSTLFFRLTLFRSNALICTHAVNMRITNTVITMKKPINRLLFWSPRVLTILFTAFVTLFAADALDGVHGFWNGALALTMHLIPTAVLVVLLAVTWRWEWVGAILFTALGGLYLVSTWGRWHWSVYAVIAGPLFAIGTLFLLNWICRAQEARTASLVSRVESND
jgi:hypothetical protein